MEKKDGILDSNIRTNSLTELGVRRPHIVFVSIVMILILGVFAFSSLQIDLFPNMNLPYIVVITTPDRTELEAEVGAEVIQHIGSNLGTWGGEFALEYFRPPNLPNFWLDTEFMAWVMYNKATEIGNFSRERAFAFMAANWSVEATSEITNALEARANMVAGVENIQSITNPFASIIIVEFSSGTDLNFVEQRLRNQIDPVRYNRVRQGNSNNVSDGFQIAFSRPQLMMLDPNMMPIFTFSTTYRHSVNEQENIAWFQRNVVQALERTTGVAQVTTSLTNTEGFSYFNGQRSFTFSIQKNANINTIEAVNNIMAVLDNLNVMTNGEFAPRITMDQAAFINNSIGGVLNNLLIGGILCILILFIFLRNVKLTLAVAISIPVSIIGTFVFMHFMGISLNIISMSGLALAVGMLTDNSIVVLENIFRLRRKGMCARDAAIKGASQIFGAILAATLTTIAVFFPMFFVEGFIMEIFLDMIWVIILSLLTSLIVAAMFLPSIYATFNKSDIVEKPAKTDGKMYKMKEGMKSRYNTALRWSIKNKYLVVVASLMAFIGSILLVFFINGFEMMPASDEGQFNTTVTINSHYGATVVGTDVTTYPARIMAISRVLTNGGDLSAYITSAPTNIPSLRQVATDALMERGRSNLNSVAISFSSGTGVMDMLAGGRANIRMSIRMIENRNITTAVAAERVYLAVNAHLDSLGLMTEAPPSAQFDTVLFAENISFGMGGGMANVGVADSVVVTLAGEMLRNDNAVTTNERINDALILVQNEIQDRMQDGRITGVLKVENEFDPNTIIQVNRQIVGSLTISMATGANIARTQNQVDAAVAYIMNQTINEEYFEGITRLADGFGEQFAETFSQMALAMLIGLILIYLILVAIFQSFKNPFITLITVPLAFTGGFLLLFVTGLPLSVVGLIGLLVLMGVITNNGIVFVDYVNKAREDGLSIDEALIAAANIRTRPIIMTAISTAFAMLPIALGFGASGGMMQAMGIICIGGLLYGTLMTLIVTPAFYKMFNREEAKKGAKK